MNVPGAMKAAICVTVCWMLASCCARDEGTREKMQEGSNAGTGGKVNLRLNLEPGRSYGLEMTVKQHIVQTIQGNRQEMDQEMSTGYLFEVKEVDGEGNLIAAGTYKWVSMKQKNPMATTEYDSRTGEEPADATGRIFSVMVDRGFQVKFTPEGRVLEVSGMNEIVDAMMDESGVPPGPMKDNLASQLKRQVGNKAMKDNFDKTFNMFAGHPVGTGEKWSKEVNVSAGFPMVVDTTWTLKELRGGNACIDVKGDFRTEEDATMESGPMTMGVELTGNQKGSIEVDMDSGWVTSGRLEQDISGTLTVISGPGLSGGTSWPISIEGLITLGPLSE